MTLRISRLAAAAVLVLLAGCSKEDAAGAVRTHLAQTAAVSASGTGIDDLPVTCRATGSTTVCAIGAGEVLTPTVAGLPPGAPPAAYAVVERGSVRYSFGAASAAAVLDEARRIAAPNQDGTPAPTPTACSRNGKPFSGTVLATADRVVLMTCDAVLDDGRTVSPWVAVVSVPYASSRGWAIVTPEVAEQMQRTKKAEAALAERAAPRPLPVDAAALADELVTLGSEVASRDLPGFGVDTAWAAAWPQVRFSQDPDASLDGWHVVFAYVASDSAVGFVAAVSDPSGGCAGLELHGPEEPSTGTARKLTGPCTLTTAAAALGVPLPSQ